MSLRTPRRGRLLLWAVPLVLLVLLLALPKAPPQAPSPPPRPAPAPVPVSQPSPAPQPVPPPFPAYEGILRPADPSAFRAAMNRLRAAALKDPDVLAELGRLLIDPQAPDALREACAWILGSLEAPAARAALLEALAASDLPPGRLAVLLRAAGQTKDPEDRGDFFDLPDSPWVHRTPSGLGVRVCTDLPDAERAQVAARLSHPDAAVRRAAAEAVRHSLGHEDARRGLLGAFPRESQAEVQAEMGDALAAWALRASVPDQGPVAALLAETALGAGTDVLRFRLQTELAQMPLAVPSREALWQVLEEGRGAEPRRRWALGLLEAHRGAFSPEEGRRLLGVGRGIARDPSAPAKLREDAARLLGRFPASESLEDLARMVRADAAWNVRLVAARSLGAIGGEEARKVLASVAASDPDPRVREAARR